MTRGGARWVIALLAVAVAAAAATAASARRPRHFTSCAPAYRLTAGGRTFSSGSCAGIIGPATRVTVATGERFSVSIVHEQDGRLDYPIPAPNGTAVRELGRHGATVRYAAVRTGTVRLMSRGTPFCLHRDPKVGSCAAFRVRVAGR